MKPKPTRNVIGFLLGLSILAISEGKAQTKLAPCNCIPPLRTEACRRYCRKFLNPGNYALADSSVVGSKDLDHYTRFKQGIENYPAKPRNQWEVGVKTGVFTISGDVSSVPFTAPNVGLQVRKAFGYLFSARLEYVHGTAKGFAWQSSTGYEGHTGNPWSDLGYTGPVFYNYKTQTNDLALEGVFSLNNIRFHKSNTGVNFYALAGFGGMIYEAKVNALGKDGQRYNFASIPITGIYKDRNSIKDTIRNLPNWDNTYETLAENHGNRRPKLFGKSFKPVGHVGAGVAFRLGNNVNLTIEDRVTITNDDLLDGQRWAEQPGGNTSVLSQNFDTYNFASVGLNINLGSKAVQPLWWLNPLDYAYQEIRKPKYMILPKPVLPDADGDGITDQFDQEQTPQGCPVDSHGVSLDTDGDGVPDCRDKEKITPTYCQPVDADGVGKCPCMDSTCFGAAAPPKTCNQNLGALPSVTFPNARSTTITSDARNLMASIATRLRNSPECKVVVTSYCSSTKAQQQRAWDRVNVIIRYMVEKEGISGDRFYWQIGQEAGDCNTVDFRTATDQDIGLPTTVPNANLGRGNEESYNSHTSFSFEFTSDPDNAEIYLVPLEDWNRIFGTSDINITLGPKELQSLSEFDINMQTPCSYPVREQPYVVVFSINNKIGIARIRPKRKNPDTNKAHKNF